MAGQAKLRGDFKERQAKAVIANQEKEEARKRARAIAEANMTPTERAKRHKARVLLTSMASLSGFAEKY